MASLLVKPEYASARGIPAVTTRLDAYMDRLADERTGQLTEPTTQSIASSIVTVLSIYRMIAEETLINSFHDYY